MKDPIHLFFVRPVLIADVMEGARCDQCDARFRTGNTMFVVSVAIEAPVDAPMISHFCSHKCRELYATQLRLECMGSS